MNSPDSNATPASRSMPLSKVTVHFCNFCGKQGNFRCKRCKKTHYCSVVCQAEDWSSHKHACKSIQLDPANEVKKQTTVLLGPEEKYVSFDFEKSGDAISPLRVYLKDLQRAKVVEGAEFKASVVEFYSPSRFFVLAQSLDVQEALQSITTVFQKLYSSTSMMTYIPCVGEICAAKFSCDQNWYRGLVQKLATDQKTANILYIDFGNQEDVPVDSIRPLAADISLLCPCVMECHISGVRPVVDNWSDECCVKVKQFLAGQIVTIRLVETDKNGHIHAVEILLSMGKHLSSFLIENGYAAEETGDDYSTEQKTISSGANVSATTENLKYLYNGKDDSTWAKPSQLPKQAIGDSLYVVVPHLLSPEEFFIQKLENAGLIQELQIKLKDHCDQHPTLHNFRPAPGSVCCAKFSEDKQWYRARVLAYSSEEQVCVGYLDFGNSEEVNLGCLLPISTSLLELPSQAIPCCLSGVQPVGEKWSEDSLLTLKQRVLNRILRIVIQGEHDGKAVVNMSDDASDPQADITKLLISAGYAVPVEATDNPQAEKATSVAVEEHDEPLLWSFAELPTDGQAVALQASVVENPGKFFCYIDSPEGLQQLTEVRAKLQLHCEANALPFDAKVGEPCCAKFPGDEAWYRAVVKEQCEGKVAVTFVDCGYTIEVELRHIRSITPQLLKLPFQAICCWLTGVEPLGSEWNSETILRFQSLVDGKQLSARVLSVTAKGYGVELQTGGQNVAAALILEKLAKCPSECLKELHGISETGARIPDSVKEDKWSQVQVQTSYNSGNSKDASDMELTAALSVLSFPVNWKTLELSPNETFQPCVAAVISPSLFYLLGPNKVDQQKLQSVMMELATFCSNSKPSISPADQNRLLPGAACCAQFSADSTWYRAVVLEVGVNEMSIIYADYGNIERVPISRIMPIPTHLLQLPFRITRCSLSGKEHFPAVWPEQVKQLFQHLLSIGVLATVQSFDGFANNLSLTLPAELGGRQLTASILQAMHMQTNTNFCHFSTEIADLIHSNTSTTSSIVPSNTKFLPATKMRLDNLASNTEQTTPQEPALLIPQLRNNSHRESLNVSQASECCCLSLKTKIDHLEQLMQQQLTIISKLFGQTKQDH